MALTTLPRAIHYYELNWKVDKNYILDSNKHQSHIQALLSKIAHLVSAKNPSRYQRMGDRDIFMNEIINKPMRNGILSMEGKLLAVRKDLFPMLLNTRTDYARDIDHLVDEGIVEATHFIVRHRADKHSDKAILCIEHNHYGAKIADFQYYMMSMGMQNGIIQNLEWIPMVNKALDKFESRIGQISEIKIKVHKDNIKKISDSKVGIFSKIAEIHDHFNEEYLTLYLKYDIRENRRRPTAHAATSPRSFITKQIEYLRKTPKAVENFEQFQVRAEDADKQDRIHAFDLLINKIKDTVQVERREQTKSIVSIDMFQKMRDSWSRLNIRV